MTHSLQRTGNRTDNRYAIASYRVMSTVPVNHVEGIWMETHPVRVKHAPRRRRRPRKTKHGKGIPWWGTSQFPSSHYSIWI